jgi:hypothetical protein
MDLFKQIVEDSALHINFKNIVSIKGRQFEIDEFLRWGDGFVDRDNKIVKEFQTTFNSSFWEIYLFALFKEYGFEIDWSHSTPDFILKAKGIDFVIEATTANAAQDKPNEWDKVLSPETFKNMKFNEINKESMIRLSNAILSKYKKYKNSYKNLSHAANKPFVIAVGPFEQPFFTMQYDRPIRALLYDYYVDEEAYYANPEAYPSGPPAVNLGSVAKDNGTELFLGFFNGAGMEEVSAILFSNSATWAKVSARGAHFAGKDKTLQYIWAFDKNGAPSTRTLSAKDYLEPISAGLQIYHNPYAKRPLDPAVFRHEGVVQDYMDNNGEWIHEERGNCLQIRTMLPVPFNPSDNAR